MACMSFLPYALGLTVRLYQQQNLYLVTSSPLLLRGFPSGVVRVTGRLLLGAQFIFGRHRGMAGMRRRRLLSRSRADVLRRRTYSGLGAVKHEPGVVVHVARKRFDVAIGGKPEPIGYKLNQRT